MSLLRDALKRAEQLKRAQQEAPMSSETMAPNASAAVHSGTDAPMVSPALSTNTPPANVSVATAPSAKSDLELAPIVPAPTITTDLSSATDRTTPSRPRDRSVPGALRPATEAIMRRDAENLSLARAAQELEVLNLSLNVRDEDISNRSMPIHTPANQSLKNKSIPHHATLPNSSMAAISTIAPEVLTAHTPPQSTPINQPKATTEAEVDLERFADRDAIKRMMTQRIAAEADAMQSRRNRTLIIGGAAVLICVAIGGWYVWKETRRYDSPVAGASLRLSPNSNTAASSAKTAPAPAIAKLPEPNSLNNPINPNIGQLPRPVEVPIATNTATVSATTAPTILPAPSTFPASPAASAPSILGNLTNQPQMITTHSAQTNQAAAQPLDTALSIGRQPIFSTSNPKVTSTNMAADNGSHSARKNITPRLVTTTNKAPIPPSTVLMAGYAALVAGNAQLALAHYAEATQATPDNIDAHLGLAVSAARTNELTVARKAFARVLELDPRNSQASAGLLLLSSAANSSGALNDTSYSTNININGANDTANNMANLVRQEGELRKLLQSAPQSAALNFALGNLYASQKRWTDAQQAFFDAFAAEPNNADFAYNLAVSLDQLNQTKLAINYYGKALALKADGRGGQFASNQAATRVAELKANSK